MNAGEIVTAIIAVVVALAAGWLMLDARRKRRAAERAQTHSNVKPQPTHDHTTLIRESTYWTRKP